MRVLIVGTAPPPGGASARALAAMAAEHLRAGDAVEVLSPDPRSAAHHVANLEGVRLPVRVALLARRFDALVLRIEPRLPLASTSGRGERAIVLVGLGLVFSMFREVTVVLDSPIAIPGGVGGRASAEFWRRATRIVVHDGHDREQVLAAPGIDPTRIVLAADRGATSTTFASSAWPSATEEALREQVLGRVRQRAHEARRANGARVDLGITNVGPLSSEVFSDRARSDLRLSSTAALTARRVARTLLERVRSSR